jgi:hypothetical protein
VLQLGKRGDARWESARGCWDLGWKRDGGGVMGWGHGDEGASDCAFLHAGLAVDVNVNDCRQPRLHLHPHLHPHLSDPHHDALPILSRPSPKLNSPYRQLKDYHPLPSPAHSSVGSTRHVDAPLVGPMRLCFA